MLKKTHHPRKAKIVHLHSSQGKVYNSTVCTLLGNLLQWVILVDFSKPFCVGMGQEKSECFVGVWLDFGRIGDDGRLNI